MQNICPKAYTSIQKQTKSDKNRFPKAKVDLGGENSEPLDFDPTDDRYNFLFLFFFLFRVGP
jgi:hypothetical protein